ncbi:ABC transporter permease [Lactobacillus terrae]|uniref:ABC transporter permease n=1 Tax=Lactobacillus terrae TaxID=2269374 RepID=UPI000C1B623B|nr:ABC transporter permease [Lactobacillus terrae]
MLINWKIHITSKKNVPKVKNTSSLKDAKKDLKNNDTTMILVVPKNASTNIANGKAINLHFYQNSSNNQTTNSVVSEIKTSVTDSLNKTVANKTNIAVLTKVLMQEQGTASVTQAVQKEVAANPAIEQSPTAMAEVQSKATSAVETQIEKQASSLIVSDSVTSTNTNINKNESKSSEILGAMFISLGAFISVVTSTLLLRSQFNSFIDMGKSKWKTFGYYETTLAIIAILAPTIGVLTFKLITGIPASDGWLLYLQTVYMTFISGQVVSIFTLLLGQIGIVINLPLALVQTVISGAIMPIATLPVFYKFISYLLPMTYNYSVSINILTGIHADILKNELGLLAVGGIAFIIILIMVSVRTFNNTFSMEKL